MPTKTPPTDATVDWRPATLDQIRKLIHAANPAIVEERKWIKPTNPAGVPVFSLDGIICTGETHKQVVKLTFARGAALADPKKLFNASLDGNVRRAIDLREGVKIEETAFKQLIRNAVAANTDAPRSTRRKEEMNAVELE